MTGSEDGKEGEIEDEAEKGEDGEKDEEMPDEQLTVEEEMDAKPATDDGKAAEAAPQEANDAAAMQDDKTKGQGHDARDDDDVKDDADDAVDENGDADADGQDDDAPSNQSGVGTSGRDTNASSSKQERGKQEGSEDRTRERKDVNPLRSLAESLKHWKERVQVATNMP